MTRYVAGSGVVLCAPVWAERSAGQSECRIARRVDQRGRERHLAGLKLEPEASQPARLDAQCHGHEWADAIDVPRRRSLRRRVERGGDTGPVSSSSAGHPWSAQARARRVSVAGSVSRSASPSATTSASRIDTAIEQRGSRATLRLFEYSIRSGTRSFRRARAHRPQSRGAAVLVHRRKPRRTSVVGVWSRRRSGIELLDDVAQSTGGSPSVAPKLMISIRLLSRNPAILLRIMSSSIRPAASRGSESFWGTFFGRQADALNISGRTPGNQYRHPARGHRQPPERRSLRWPRQRGRAHPSPSPSTTGRGGTPCQNAGAACHRARPWRYPSWSRNPLATRRTMST